jgi:formate dehydrogenase subunit beta
MNTVIPVENGEVLAAVRGFLRRLLEVQLVEALFVPLEVDEGAILPALVTDPARLSVANPLTPVMPINAARAVSALTGKQTPARLGALLRPCELRALIELVKLRQATLENVLLISIDCPGTYEYFEYTTWQHEDHKSPGFILSDYLAAAQESREPTYTGLTQRTACRMCVQPVPEQADIYLQLFGVDTSRGIPVRLRDDIANNLGMMENPHPDATEHQAAVERLVSAHRQVREKELQDIRARLNSDGGLAGLFATCIRCHNCMTACPICYCKTCLFRTASFDHPPVYYLDAARRKGATRMLGDTLLFHMTRLNHMGLSCVGCGMCTSACPSHIPVGTVFSAVGEQVQTVFEYHPGRDVSESLPLVTFQENEWATLGEER